MSQEPLISVIVPIYKVEEYLPQCVDSILGQSYRNLEVILVDDGSPDGSGDICDAYAAKDARVRVIHKENGGLSSARNAGIDIASGEYLAFVDSDDWIAEDAYETLLSAALTQGVRLVCAGRYDVEESSGETTVGLCPVKDEVVTGKELVRRIFFWEHLDSAAWDKLYGRELFRQIRYPVGRVVEDVPTTYRIALDAGKAAMVAKPVYYYRHRGNSITTSSLSEKTFHAVENAELVYRDIQKRELELEDAAHYFWVESVTWVIALLQQSDSTERRKFAAKYRKLKRELAGELGFVLRCRHIGAWEKASSILMVLGLYGRFWRVYHLLKRDGIVQL